MKLDKDTVIKHHFWFLLATAMPLALIGIVLLMTVVSSLIASNRKKLESDLKGTKVSDPAKNDVWMQQIKKRVAEMKKREKEVWEEAYKSEEYLFTWPEEVEKKFRFKDGLFASEVKAEKPGPVTPVDPKTEEHSVIKHFNGIMLGTAPLDDDEGAQGAVVMKVSDGKATKIFRPTRKMTLTNSDGKKINTFVDIKKDDRVSITYVEGKYFNDPLTEEEQNYFMRPREGYRSQIAGIIKQVQPLETNGKGVVQLRAYLYSEKKGVPVLPPDTAPFLRFVEKEWINDEGDISAEAWMAQEDLWIQRELYSLVRQSNDMVSVMQGTGGTEQGKLYTFTNPNWKLELSLKDRTLFANITNLLSRRQRLDVGFLVTFREGEGVDPEPITIEGEPLDPNKSKSRFIQIPGVRPSGIYRVQQAINWETAAVKRIDQVSIGSLADGDCCQSHRTLPNGLKPFKEAPKKDGADKGNLGPGGPSGTGSDAKMPMMVGQGQGMGNQKTESKKTLNGLNANRYMEEPKPEVRLVPFAISLIVGQEHIDRVLYTFSKSPLRILMTQVVVNRYPHSVRPTGVQQPGPSNTGVNRAGPAGGKVGMPGFPGGGYGASGYGAGGYGGGSLGGARFGGFGGFGGNFGGGTFGGGAGLGQGRSAITGGDSQEDNVELVIYGIASLYQRYPPRPPETAAPVQ
jgi:hypothetical protein